MILIVCDAKRANLNFTVEQNTDSTHLNLDPKFLGHGAHLFVADDRFLSQT